MTSECLLHFRWRLVAVEEQKWIWWLCGITGWALDIRNIGFLLHLWMTSVLQSLPLILSLVPVRILWGRRHTHPQMHCTYTDGLLKPSVVRIEESCDATSWENRASKDFHISPVKSGSPPGAQMLLIFRDPERILMCHQSSKLLRGIGSDFIVWSGKCPLPPMFLDLIVRHLVMHRYRILASVSTQWAEGDVWTIGMITLQLSYFRQFAVWLTKGSESSSSLEDSSVWIQISASFLPTARPWISHQTFTNLRIFNWEIGTQKSGRLISQENACYASLRTWVGYSTPKESPATSLGRRENSSGLMDSFFSWMDEFYGTLSQKITWSAIKEDTSCWLPASSCIYTYMHISL